MPSIFAILRHVATCAVSPTLPLPLRKPCETSLRVAEVDVEMKEEEEVRSDGKKKGPEMEGTACEVDKVPGSLYYSGSTILEFLLLLYQLERSRLHLVQVPI